VPILHALKRRCGLSRKAVTIDLLFRMLNLFLDCPWNGGRFKPRGVTRWFECSILPSLRSAFPEEGDDKRLATQHL
jgi:hypothetical protein